MSNFNAPIVLYAATTNGYSGVESEYKNATQEMQEYESIFKRADEQYNETSAISQDYSPEIYEKYNFSDIGIGWSYSPKNDRGFYRCTVATSNFNNQIESISKNYYVYQEEFKYDEQNRCTDYSYVDFHSDKDYELKYDEFGNIIEVEKNGKEATYEYNNGKLASKTEDNTTIFYSPDGNIDSVSIRDEENGATETFKYAYDKNGRAKNATYTCIFDDKSEKKITGSYKFSYDKKTGLLEEIKYKSSDKEYNGTWIADFTANPPSARLK